MKKLKEKLNNLLKENNAYQNFLLSQIKQIDEQIEENQEAQKRLRTIKAKSWGRADLVRKRFRAVDFDKDGFEIEPNADSVKHTLLEENNTIKPNFPTRTWTKNDRQRLRDAVLHQNQQKLLDALPLRNDLTPQLYTKKCKEISKMKSTTKSMKLVDFTDDEINWTTVTEQYLPDRSARECQLQWELSVSPQVSVKAWSKDEDKKLIYLVREKHNHQNWREIAKDLGSGRTPAQCFQRFQRVFRGARVKSKWTPEEDEILTKAVYRFGARNWQRIAMYLPGRTGQQCLHRWDKTANPDIQLGRWESVPDMYLAMAVQAHGTKRWSDVQQHVPHRTDVQCRERWLNVLSPRLKKDEWTDQEKTKLLALVEKHGLGKWAVIAKELYPRTDNQCWRKWRNLVSSKDVKKYQTMVDRRHKMMANNLVNIDGFRSDLATTDFDVTEAEVKEFDYLRKLQQAGERGIPRKTRKRWAQEVAKLKAAAAGRQVNQQDIDESPLLKEKLPNPKPKRKGRPRKRQSLTTTTTSSTVLQSHIPPPSFPASLQRLNKRQKRTHSLTDLESTTKDLESSTKDLESTKNLESTTKNLESTKNLELSNLSNPSPIRLTRSQTRKNNNQS